LCNPKYLLRMTNCLLPTPTIITTHPTYYQPPYLLPTTTRSHSLARSSIATHKHQMSAKQNKTKKPKSFSCYPLLLISIIV